MATARAVPAFRAELAVSKQLVALLSAGHLGALAISVILTLSTPELAVLCVAVVLSWFWTIHRHALLRSPHSFLALELEGEQSCALKRRDGRWLRGRIGDSSYVLPWLIVLHVAVEHQRFEARVVLFADSMMTESHRRLRMRLRWVRYGGPDV